jgi:hypothetical protein
MSEFVKAGLKLAAGALEDKEVAKFAGELLGDFLYEKSLVHHNTQDLTHHKLVTVFRNNIHNPCVMYAFTLLPADQALQTAKDFLIAGNAVPVRLTDTADGWLVIGAARKPLTLREEFYVRMNFDRAPHVYLLLIKQTNYGSHVYAGCRYTDHRKINVRNWFGRAASDRTYRLLISACVRAPILLVDDSNLTTLP